MDEDERHTVEAVRRACLALLLEAYEEAGMAGLCGEGRFELAVDRLRSAPLEALLARARDGRAG